MAMMGRTFQSAVLRSSVDIVPKDAVARLAPWLREPLAHQLWAVDMKLLNGVISAEVLGTLPPERQIVARLMAGGLNYDFFKGFPLSVPRKLVDDVLAGNLPTWPELALLPEQGNILRLRVIAEASGDGDQEALWRLLTAQTGWEYQHRIAALERLWSLPASKPLIAGTASLIYQHTPSAEIALSLLWRRGHANETLLTEVRKRGPSGTDLTVQAQLALVAPERYRAQFLQLLAQEPIDGSGSGRLFNLFMNVVQDGNHLDHRLQDLAIILSDPLCRNKLITTEKTKYIHQAAVAAHVLNQLFQKDRSPQNVLIPQELVWAMSDPIGAPAAWDRWVALLTPIAHPATDGSTPTSTGPTNR